MAFLDEIRERKLAVGIAGTVLLVAFITIWSQNCSSTLKINHALFTGIGQVAAEETITAAHGPGRVVAVIDASYTMTGTAHFDEWQAFRRELKKHTISLTTTNVEVDPNDSSPGCPSLVFKKLMEQSADASGIVFFVSLPDWNLLRQYQWLPERSPVKIIVVDTGSLPAQGYYNGYFANGLLSALIGARVEPAPVLPVEPKTPREWFDRYFQVFTPQNTGGNQ